MNAIIEKRDESREALALRVRSRQLPSFQATTTDISPGGMQLEVAAPLTVNSRLILELDLGHLGRPLKCTAVVRWCQIGKGIRAGLEFESMSAEKQEALSDCIRRYLFQARRIVTTPTTPVLEGRFARVSGEQAECIEEALEAGLVLAELNEAGLILTLEVEGRPEEWLFPEAALLVCSSVPDRIGSLRIAPAEGERLLYEFRNAEEILLLAFHTPLDQMPTTKPSEISRT